MAKKTVEGKAYYEDSRGALVPLENLRVLDVLRDETVQEIIEAAKEMNNLMIDFKKKVAQKIEEFVELSASEHGVDFGGTKGNIKLRTIDGRFLVQVAQNETIDFNEQLQIAEHLIEECISERSANADPVLLAMVKAAFTQDHTGNVNVRDIMKLRKYEIDDPKWKEAMEAIQNSIETTGTKEYIRFYERRPGDKKMTAISLDLACI